MIIVIRLLLCVLFCGPVLLALSLWQIAYADAILLQHRCCIPNTQQLDTKRQLPYIYDIVITVHVEDEFHISGAATLQ